MLKSTSPLCYECERYGHYDYPYISKNLYTDIVHINDFDNLRIAIDAIVESNTFTLDEIHVYEKSISDDQYALIESSIPSYDVRHSLSTPRIELGTEHEIVVIVSLLSSCG